MNTIWWWDLVADVYVRPFLQHGTSSVNPTLLAEDMEHRVTLLGIDCLSIKSLYFHLSERFRRPWKICWHPPPFEILQLLLCQPTLADFGTVSVIFHTLMYILVPTDIGWRTSSSAGEISGRASMAALNPGRSPATARSYNYRVDEPSWDSNNNQ